MLNNNYLRIYSLAGFARVTPNLFVYETERDLIIVDCGIGFPDDNRQGDQLLVPDLSPIKDRLNKLRAIIISHGHDDHLGGLPYILPQLPKNIPIYAPRWAAALGQLKLKEANLINQIREFNQSNHLEFGDFSLDFIQVTHSILDTYHLVIKTPIGTFYHAADFKLDLIPVTGPATNQNRIRAISRQKVICLLSDCLRAENPGFTPPEAKLSEMFEKEIANFPGKILVTAISSNISRFKQAIDVSLKNQRKIVVVGRTIKQSLEIAQSLKYLTYPPSVFIDRQKMADYPPGRLTLLVAGSQGQIGSALEKISSQQLADVHIMPGDKVIFSTDYIPGNELAIYRLINDLYRLGAQVVYPDVHANVHVSGHGSQKDLAKLIKMVKPQYLLPIGGEYRHLIAYRNLAQNLGYTSRQVIIADNGQVWQFSPNQPPKNVFNIQTKLLPVVQPSF